jgi:hypothetical protein
MSSWFTYVEMGVAHDHGAGISSVLVNRAIGKRGLVSVGHVRALPRGSATVLVVNKRIEVPEWTPLVEVRQ